LSSEEPKKSTSPPTKTSKDPGKKRRADNERADEILATVGADPGDKALEYAPAGLEKLGKELTDDQICVLNTILGDPFASPEKEAKTDVYRKLFAAFKRSGIGDTKGDEQRFFKIIKDPQFHEIVHVTGRGLVGLRVVKILDKLCDMAEAGDQTAIDRVLEVAGFIKSKYDFYAEDVERRRPGINVGEINFGSKTDKDLRAILDGLVDVTDSAEIIG